MRPGFVDRSSSRDLATGTGSGLSEAQEQVVGCAARNGGSEKAESTAAGLVASVAGKAAEG